VEVHQSTFESNIAPDGGIVHLTGGVVAVIRSSTLQLNQHGTGTRRGLIYLDSSSTAIVDKCTIRKDSNQSAYYAQGTFIVRDSTLALDKVDMDATSVYPAANAGLCPSFSLQTVNWKCMDPSKNPPNCNAYDANPKGQYPWGVTCSSCRAGTTKVPSELATSYPYLDWACECQAGSAGKDCTRCPLGTFMPTNHTVVMQVSGLTPIHIAPPQLIHRAHTLHSCTVLMHWTHILYPHTVLIHCTHTLYSYCCSDTLCGYTVCSASHWRASKGTILPQTTLARSVLPTVTANSRAFRWKPSSRQKGSGVRQTILQTSTNALQSTLAPEERLPSRTMSAVMDSARMGM
jgi:hypothetical protein